MISSVSSHVFVAARVRKSTAENRNFAIRARGKDLLVECEKTIKSFPFEAVFDQESTQREVFDVVAKPIIDGCVNDGFHGTVMAYGQTGSGKTYTMWGPSAGPQGLIPLSVGYLFDVLSRRNLQSFELNFSLLEIYNDEMFDLFNVNGRKLKIRSSGDSTYAEGLKEYTAHSKDELLSTVEKAWNNRRVLATKANVVSSRSHVVFSLRIVQSVGDSFTKSTRTTRLNLVDLAGSERQKDADTKGTALKEAGSINQSLHVLGKVVRCLAKGSDTNKAPYRESKLTYLLQDSLGGTAKSAILIQLRPDKRYLENSCSTLSFGDMVRSVKNTVVANEKKTEVDVEKLLERLHAETAQRIQIQKQLDVMEKENQMLHKKIDDVVLQNRHLQENMRMMQGLPSNLTFSESFVRAPFDCTQANELKDSGSHEMDIPIEEMEESEYQSASEDLSMDDSSLIHSISLSYSIDDDSIEERKDLSDFTFTSPPPEQASFSQITASPMEENDKNKQLEKSLENLSMRSNLPVNLVGKSRRRAMHLA